MSRDDCRACHEYNQLTRRSFVGLSAGVVAAAVAPAWLPRVVFADSESGSRDIVVSLFLRGGCDALTICPPFTESSYYDLRPTLAVPPPDASGGERAIDLDGRFGFAPSLAPLMDPYRAGQLLVVHACGLENPTRSHFEAMHFMEVGMGNPPGHLYTGWLGRHLASTAPTVAGALLRGVSIGAGLPRTLAGGTASVPVGDPAEYEFEGRPISRGERKTATREMYAAAEASLAATAESTFATIDLLKRINFRGYRPAGGAEYPDDDFGYGLSSVAALIKADVGVEAVALDLGGWDTHELQGPVDGFMSLLMASLAAGLAAFHRDLSASGREDVILVAMSEFGRNAFENGSAGTDHGHAGLMLAMGGGIAGGRVLTDWPGLDEDRLYQGRDLEITTDYRDVLTEILSRRLANPDYRSVFPDPRYRPKVLGVTV